MTEPAGLSWPTTKAGKLQRAVLEVLGEHQTRGELPTSARFIWYELEQRGVVRVPAEVQAEEPTP